MLEQGIVIAVQLPGKQAVERGTVVRCNKRGSSCILELEGGEQATVNLTRVAYTVVEGEGGIAAAAAAAGDTGGPQEAQQQANGVHSGSDDGAGSSGDEGEAGQRQQDPSDSEEGGSGDGSDDEGGSEGGSDEDDGDDEDELAPQLDAFQPEAAARLEALTAAIEDPGAFLQPSSQVADLARGAAKALYDYAAAAAALEGAQAARGGGALLPELYVEGFDPEQIWLQLEMAAEPALKRARKLLRKVGPDPVLLEPDMEEALDDLLGGASASEDSEGAGASEDESSGDDDDSAGVGAPADLAALDYEAMLAAGAQQAQRGGRRRGDEPDSEEDDLMGGGSSGDEEGEGLSDDEDDGELGSESEGEGAGGALAGRKRKAAPAGFEDEFLKVDDLERFLEEAEAEAARGDEDGEGQEVDESEEDEFDEAAEGEGGSDSDADMDALLANAVKLAGAKAKKRRVRFADESEEEEDGEGDGDALVDGMRPEEARYEDFFGPRKATPFRKRPAAGGGRVAEEGEGEDDEEDEMEGEEGDEEELRRMLLGEGGLSGDEDEDEEGEGEGRQQPSTHERRLQKVAEKVRNLESEAMAEKDWTMKGEIMAGQRPKNSALEVDLDFETSVKPPPQPTEESTKSLEELIKKRIADARFDDVVRIVAAPPETKKTTIELDDKKSSKGLGELYEEEYQRAVTGVSEDKDEEVRVAARAQFAALCAKLDALSHLHFTPKPLIEEVTVKVDVPAILMEEVAPQYVSEASMRAPEEVFAGQQGGAPASEAELSREDRKRRRAQKKRAGKKRRAQKEEERANRAAAQGGTAPLAGRKSEAEELLAKKMKKSKESKGSKEAQAGPRMDYSKSAAVFAKIQEHRDGGGASKGASGTAGRGEGAGGTAPAAQFKL